MVREALSRHYGGRGQDELCLGYLLQMYGVDKTFEKIMHIYNK